MTDKFTAGLIAGFLAGMVSIVFELVFVSLLHLSQPSFLVFSGTMLYRHLPQNLFEQLVAAIVHLLFSAYMGSIFAYFLGWVSDRYDLLKGIVWGLAVTWVIWAVTFLFGTRPDNSTPIHVIENDLSATVYGVTLALFYRFAHRKNQPTE